MKTESSLMYNYSLIIRWRKHPTSVEKHLSLFFGTRFADNVLTQTYSLILKILGYHIFLTSEAKIETENLKGNWQVFTSVQMLHPRSVG